MIELSRTQDEEVGDGTTTVIILGTLRRFQTLDVMQNPKAEKKIKKFANTCFLL
jgi:chaperonin GroEL (HSP60 family)